MLRIVQIRPDSSSPSTSADRECANRRIPLAGLSRQEDLHLIGRIGEYQSDNIGLLPRYRFPMDISSLTYFLQRPNHSNSTDRDTDTLVHSLHVNTVHRYHLRALNEAHKDTRCLVLDFCSLFEWILPLSRPGAAAETKYS